MDLYIETLTGTAFELRVSPFETIMSVKAKIQRLEGIPVSQQHLIWQCKELEDDYCLHDYSVHDGATLKLVLALRGGPINTRRIPMEDSALREMAEYMEANQEELLEKLPGNRQVTLLVFREGDQLNFFRVVDRGDGTLSPLSESLSGTSVYNLYDDEEDEEVPQREKVEENMKMREKMSELRNKLENMTVTKKPAKKKPHPPLTGLTARHSIPSGRSLNRNLCLPPVGISPTAMGPFSLNHQDPDDDEVASDVIHHHHHHHHHHRRDVVASPHRDAGLDNDVSKLVVADDETDKEDQACKLSPPIYKPRNATNCDSEIRLARRGTRLPEDASMKESLHLPPARKAKYQYEHSKHTNPTSTIRGYKDLVLDNLKGNLRSTSRYERRKEYTLESLSSEEARAMSGLLRQASIERLGQSRISAFPASTSRSKLTYPSDHGTTTATATETAGSRLMSGRLSKLPPGAVMREPHPPSGGPSRLLVSPGHRLPPVKPAQGAGGGAIKKKSQHKRCYVCAKKTGLANSYQCRCGNNYCTLHRYAEAHECTFDYKTEGRKLLEQTNPVVTAPKLPKI